MAVTYPFQSITVSSDSAPFLSLQYNLVVGSVAQDSLTLATDFAEIQNVAMNNGNLEWTESNGTITALTSEVDLILGPSYNYINLNTNRTAEIGGLVMNEKTRAIVSDEWLAAFASGALTVEYEQTLGLDAIDTIISGGGGGKVTLADYSLKDGLANITTIGFYDGGAVIDFGISAIASPPEVVADAIV